MMDSLKACECGGRAVFNAGDTVLCGAWNWLHDHCVPILAMKCRETYVIEGKCAESEGDTLLADRCRAEVKNIDDILRIWKQRWQSAGR